MKNVAPGSAVRVTTTGETIQVTLAYAAIDAMLEAYGQYHVLHPGHGAKLHFIVFIFCVSKQRHGWF